MSPCDCSVILIIILITLLSGIYFASNNLVTTDWIEENDLFDVASIKLHKYNVQPNVECSDGFVEGNVTFVSEIDIKSINLESKKQVVYQIKRKDMSSFKMICFIIDVYTCTGEQGTHCYCESKPGSVVVHLVFAVSPDLSEALLRGRLIGTDHWEESELQMFPKLYGPNQSNVELKIDNELMTTSNNMVNVTNTAVNILFQCTKTTPTPCLLEITNSQNHQTLARSDGLISICCNVREVLNLTFTFVFCHSRNQKNTFYYIFTPTYTNETQLLKEAGGKNYLNELFTSLTIYVGIFLSGVFVGKWPFHLLYNRYLRRRLQTLLRMVVGVLPWKPRIFYLGATVTEDKYAEIMTSLQYEHSRPQECIENRITVSCPKENKHNQFIGLEDLGTKRENEYMRKKDENVDRLIISVYHLTVQLDVKKCCSSRKKVWPDTQVPYPLTSSETPTATIRTGTGRVWRVTKYTNGVDKCGGEHREHKTCPCAQCEKSGTPKSVWAKISVSTSKALVYDGFEAEDVQCRLFYDNLNPAELLEGFRVENDNIATDFCSLTCYTCNIALIKKLKEHLEEFNETNNKIQSLQTTLTRLNGFVFIVSHPHGEEKKISYGKIVHKNEIVGVGTRLVYTAPTCPGSSGAPVIAPAHCSSWSYHTQVVHCGQIDSQHNCSGFFSTPVTL